MPDIWLNDFHTSLNDTLYIILFDALGQMYFWLFP